MLGVHATVRLFQTSRSLNNITGYLSAAVLTNCFSEGAMEYPASVICVSCFTPRCAGQDALAQ